MKRSVATLVLAVIAATVATAQQPPQGLPQLDAGWRPRIVRISDSRRVTAEHRRTILTNIAAAETLIRSVEEFAKPRGFDARSNYDRAVFALHQKLDWAAFNRLLDQQP